MAAAKGGNRSAYLDMPEVLQLLGSPQVLAATATASRSVAKEIRHLLPINEVVVDDTVRANLNLEDERNLQARENCLVSIVATGDKCVVYVNARDAAVALARTLRRRIPELAPAIAFYHAGL